MLVYLASEGSYDRSVNNTFFHITRFLGSSDSLWNLSKYYLSKGNMYIMSYLLFSIMPRLSYSRMTTNSIVVSNQLLKRIIIVIKYHLALSLDCLLLIFFIQNIIIDKFMSRKSKTLC